VKELPLAFRSIFLEGNLPSEPMLIPGTKKWYEIAIRPKDLETLIQGIAIILCEGQLSERLRTRMRICEQHGVTEIADRIKVYRLLTALSKAGTLQAHWVARREEGKFRDWRAVQLFDPDEINRHLDGRDLAEVAREFALHSQDKRAIDAKGSAGVAAAAQPNVGGAGEGTARGGPPFQSARDLADFVRQDGAAVESFLRRYRERFSDCFREAEGQRRNEPRYLYRVKDVWPALREHFLSQSTDG
jgi:hypothetical protein